MKLKIPLLIFIYICLSSVTHSHAMAIKDLLNPMDISIDDQSTEECSEVFLKKTKAGYCDLCEKDFKQLPCHKWYRHGQGSQPVKCDYCNASIAKGSLQQHIKQVHGKGTQKVDCTYPGCESQVAVYRLQRHIKEIHEQDSEKVSCTYPGCKSKVAAYNLKQHLQSHIQYLQCNKCAFSCRFSFSMYNHLSKLHNLETPWKRYYSRVSNDNPDIITHT